MADLMDAIIAAKLFGSNGSGGNLPNVTSENNGNILAVVDGQWAAQPEGSIFCEVTIDHDSENELLYGLYYDSQIEGIKMDLLQHGQTYKMYCGLNAIQVVTNDSVSASLMPLINSIEPITITTDTRTKFTMFYPITGSSMTLSFGWGY